MTPAETASIRKARKSVIRAERQKRVAEYRERRRRRAEARKGLAVHAAPLEPSYAATRGAKFTCWCEPGQHAFLSPSFQATVCEGHRGE